MNELSLQNYYNLFLTSIRKYNIVVVLTFSNQDTENNYVSVLCIVFSF